MTFSRCRRILFSQFALQPAGLFLLPLALVTVLPFPWVYAFYQTLTARADAESGGLRNLLKKSWREARLWPGQNIQLLAIMTAFGLYVFLNWTTVCYVLPGLVKLLFGVESMFTRSGESLLNTTFFAAMFCLTYLCVDPLLKAAYALRCFYGESRQSGEDLKADLRQFTLPARSLAATLTLVATLFGAVAGFGAPAASSPTPQSSPPAVSTPQLDRAIQDTIHQRKYTWRAPRNKANEPEVKTDGGVISRFIERVRDMLGKWFKGFGSWLERLLRKIFGGQSQTAPTPSTGYNWILLLQFLLWVLVAAVLAGITLFLYRIVRDRRRRDAIIASEPIQPLPNLADENVGADQMPEDGWTKLARELLGRGDFRLALRAFYLASLANLAGRNLITLAKFKSNREYERELGRRGHAFPDLLSRFGQNVSIFDRSWYGLHEINGDQVTQFAANVERIKAGI
jgi:hypothetical protein